MTDDPRYSPSQQSGRGMPNQQAGAGYTQGGYQTQAGYQQSYDWRYASAQQPGSQQSWDPYRAAQAGNTAVLPPVAGAPARKRSRPVALTVGALAIAAVSAGMGGMVAVMSQPQSGPITTIATAAPNGRAVPTANVPVGSVEQVAAVTIGVSVGSAEGGGWT